MGTRRQTKPDSKYRHFIRKWRKFRNLTQEQLAGRVNASVSSISQLETGKQGYSQSILEDLAVALSCEPWDLLNVDPTKDGEVVDITNMLKEASPEVQAEALGYVKGLLRRNH